MQFLAPVLLSLAATPPVAVANHGCPPEYVERFDPGPVEAGPLSLSSVSCVTFGLGSFGTSNPIVSPNGGGIAFWQDGPSPIEIAALDGSGRVSLPNRVTFRNFVFMGDDFGTARDAFAWASDSRSLWGVRQRIGSPAGWAFSGLTPISIGRDGTIRELPALEHPAGPLDGILWVGGDGLALAQFGTRGGYYRPEHDDAAPTLAMVDAGRGRVLAAFPASGVPGLAERVRQWGLRASGAAATVLSDGRIRAVVQFSRWADRPPGTPAGAEPIMRPGLWLVWTQGEALRVWPAPYPGDRSNPVAFSPDGSKLLVVRPLQPDGVQIQCRIPCRGPPPPPPTPVDGYAAELIDIASGRVLWRVPARADQFWRTRAPPVISGDGRYALIQTPPEGDRNSIAVIDMRTGRIVQRIAPTRTWSNQHSAGFTADGRAWVLMGSFMLVYDVPSG